MEGVTENGAAADGSARPEGFAGWLDGLAAATRVMERLADRHGRSACEWRRRFETEGLAEFLRYAEGEAQSSAMCREVSRRLSVVYERACHARLVAFASGWDEGVVGLVVGGINRVAEGAAARRMERAAAMAGAEVGPAERALGYPSVKAYAEEVGRWANGLADLLLALPGEIEKANERRAAGVAKSADPSLFDRLESLIKASVKAEIKASVKEGMEDMKESMAEGEERVKASVADSAASVKAEIKAQGKNVRRDAKAGARDGVLKYNDDVLIHGKDGKRKPGGGRRAVSDTDGRQCRAMLDLGEKVRRGERKALGSFAAYADRVIRMAFDPSDNPFTYPDGASSADREKVRTMLVKRFKTYLKRLDPSMKIEDALPLA